MGKRISSPHRSLTPACDGSLERGRVWFNASSWCMSRTCSPRSSKRTCKESFWKVRAQMEDTRLARCSLVGWLRLVALERGALISIATCMTGRFRCSPNLPSYPTCTLYTLHCVQKPRSLHLPEPYPGLRSSCVVCHVSCLCIAFRRGSSAN